MTKIGLNSLKCDWYGATFNNLKNSTDVHFNLINEIRIGFELITGKDVIFKPSMKGFRGYPLSGVLEFVDVETGVIGEQICIIGYGSPRRDMGVHVSVSGKYSHEFREFVLSKMEDNPLFYHRVSRCDVAFDFIELEDVDSVFKRFSEFAVRRGLSTHYEGDWDYCKKGRTYYIGRPGSAVRIVLYEKGIQQINDKVIEDAPHIRNWLRLEVRVTGQKGRGANIPYSTLKEIMFCTKNIRDLVAYALPQFDFNALKPEHLSVVPRSNSDSLTSFTYMCNTYKRVINSVLLERFDGDIDAFFEYFSSIVFDD